MRIWYYAQTLHIVGTRYQSPYGWWFSDFLCVSPEILGDRKKNRPP
ncbi:MAG: hypothetical protein LDL41_16660 [Coleofasciculus sp. S288]|nr:hypothetical protein [Coleofasciculus sp. S288]